MDMKNYKNVQAKISTLIEEIDPASLGGRGEYDNLVNAIIRNFIVKKNVLSDSSLRDIIQDQYKAYGLTKKELSQLLDEIKKVKQENE